MNTEHIRRGFAAIGARFILSPEIQRRNTAASAGYAIDIGRDRHGEFFQLRVAPEAEARLKLLILQARPSDRHLLLLCKGDAKDRYLCGHDERSWFVAAVPGGASSVADAFETLKPREVRTVQGRNGLTARQRNRRRNRAFRRQGEWFFVPAPELVVDPKLVLRDEPIRRGAGNAHLVEWLYRQGGQRVYVHRRWPNGVSEEDYSRILAQNPGIRPSEWRVMVRDPLVYARGSVRHPDHRTIVLHGWHRVLMNTETQSRAMAHMAFLD